MTAIIFGMRPIIADNHGSVRLAVLSFSHDPDGLMTSAANSSGTITNSYDAADRMTQVDSPAGTLNFGYCGWNGKCRLKN